MIAFGFLDIKADLLDPFRDVEIEHFARCGHARPPTVPRSRGTAHSVPAQQADAGDRPIEGAAAGTCHSVLIVKMARAVDADPEIDLRLGKKFAPRIVDQRAVGLKRMHDLQICGGRRASTKANAPDKMRSGRTIGSPACHTTESPSPSHPEAKTCENKLCSVSALQPPSSCGSADSNICKRYCRTGSAARPSRSNVRHSRPRNRRGCGHPLTSSATNCSSCSSCASYSSSASPSRPMPVPRRPSPNCATRRSACCCRPVSRRRRHGRNSVANGGKPLGQPVLIGGARLRPGRPLACGTRRCRAEQQRNLRPPPPELSTPGSSDTSAAASSHLPHRVSGVRANRLNLERVAGSPAARSARR